MAYVVEWNSPSFILKVTLISPMYTGPAAGGFCHTKVKFDGTHRLSTSHKYSTSDIAPKENVKAAFILVISHQLHDWLDVRVKRTKNPSFLYKKAHFFIVTYFNMHVVFIVPFNETFIRYKINAGQILAWFHLRGRGFKHKAMCKMPNFFEIFNFFGMNFQITDKEFC